jgi:hypothetical protein
MHLHRLPSSDALGWLAAAGAAAAAVWVPLALLFGHGFVGKLEWTLGGLFLATPYFALTAGVTLAAYGIGAAFSFGALFGAFLLFLIGGGCGEEGHVTGAMWAIGAVAYLGGGAWSLQRPKRAWWGLPASVLASALLVVLLATAFTGSTGACLS